jgi:hypothetical protein
MILQILSKPLTWLIIIIIFLAIGLKIQTDILKSTQVNLEVSRNNEKAYAESLTQWKDVYGIEHTKSRMFEETLSSFKNSSDSLNQLLVSEIKRQNIKLKNVERAFYQKSGIDTTIYRDINIPTMPDTVIDLSNEYIKAIL